MAHLMVASKGVTVSEARLDAARLETRLTISLQTRQRARERAASEAHLMVASKGVAVSEARLEAAPLETRWTIRLTIRLQTR